MNDKSPTKSLMKRLEARIKKIESDAIDQAMEEFVPKGYKKENIRSLLGFKKNKKSKGGIVKKNKGGLMVKPKAAKRGY